MDHHIAAPSCGLINNEIDTKIGHWRRHWKLVGDGRGWRGMSKALGDWDWWVRAGSGGGRVGDDAIGGM